MIATSMTNQSRWGTCTGVVLALLLVVPAGMAQVSMKSSAPLPTAIDAQDRATLMDGLAREGMSELLDHFAATEPINDVVLRQQLHLAQLRLLANDPTRTASQREKALDEAITSLRQLINQHRDHEQRPLWQTDLAELQLFSLLQSRHGSAAEFFEFGVPSIAQIDAFEKVVPEMVESLLDADLRFITLQSELPKTADHVTRRVNTGLWERMITHYFHTRTPYLLAHAGYYTTLLPDAHPIWARLSNHPGLGTLGQTTAQTRAQLLSVAAERLEKLLLDRAPNMEGLQEAVQSLWGRVLLAQNKSTEAISHFDAVINAGNGDLADLTARMGKAIAMERNRQVGPAIDALGALKTHASVQSHLLHRLLLIDTLHGVLLRRAMAAPADRRDSLLAQAYQPYDELLNAPTLGDAAGPLRNYVHERWDRSITDDTKLDALPAMVVMAAGQFSRSQGQNFMLELEGSSPGAERQQSREQGRRRLDRAIALSQSVLQRRNLQPAVRAGAMFNLALATYFRDQTDLKTQLDAARLLIDLGEQLPEQPISEEAMQSAITILRALHAKSPRHEDASALYERAVKVLLSRFPASAVTDHERLYHGFHVLQSAGRYAEAASIYARVPASHPDYFAAQKERLTCLQELFRTATGDARKSAANTVMNAANALRDQATRTMEDSNSPQAASARTAAGAARLVLADMAIEQGDPAAGLRILDGFETDFSDQDWLVRRAMQKRILALVDVGPIDRAAQQASLMMAQFPSEAAPVLMVVLMRLDQMVEDLRGKAALERVERNRNDLHAQSVNLAQTASRMARKLVDWQATRKLANDEMLGHKLVLAKSLRMAGQAQESLDLIKPMANQFPDDAFVIHAMGESYFLLGGASNLKAAAPFFDKLITRMQPENRKYPALWWNAWVRRLSINDQLGLATHEIPLRVQQLMLLDATLGGDVFRLELERLRNKYAVTR